MKATYSPEDNKLRLYPDSRLPSDLYKRVREAGFIWAPKQELFVAPTWSPSREDLLLELCEEIEDEDTSLVDRAEQRAERFQDYSASRADDATQAHKAVKSICDHIPLGQPILVGHHSEKRARRDAEKIENGMRRAVRMWEQSQYWKDRAKGAIHAAKYKERPDVRARRIKKLEAEARAVQRRKDHAVKALSLWSRPLCHEDALKIAGDSPFGDFALPRKEGDKPDFTQHPSAYAALSNSYPTLYAHRTLEEVLEAGRKSYPPRIEDCDRWLAHYTNRLDYEKAMLAEDGGTVADRKGPEAGGGCRCWASPRGGWSYIQKVNKVSVTVLDNWGNGGGNFTRTIPFDKLAAIMTAAEVQAARDCGTLIESSDKTGFFLRGNGNDGEAVRALPDKPKQAEPFEAMKETLKAGVQVVSAPQLFPTPPDIAERVIDEASIELRHTILEPSAGTGRLLDAIALSLDGWTGEKVVAVENNHSLANGLRAKYSKVDVRCSDFLACNGDLGQFDRIVMNPPFSHGQDIAHIKHALNFLKPGGRLVALCANGPKQQAELKPMADEWTELEPGAFSGEGTGVNVAMLIIDKP